MLVIFIFFEIFKQLFIYYAGEEASTWYLDLRNGNGSTGKGEPKDPADATLTMNSEQFFAMFSGTKNVLYKY